MHIAQNLALLKVIFQKLEFIRIVFSTLLVQLANKYQ